MDNVMEVCLDRIALEGRPDFEREIFEKMTDTVKIKNHLINRGSITGAEAYRLYGIYRLADVIYKLRHKKEPHMDIQMEMVYGRDRWGQPVQYGRYYI